MIAAPTAWSAGRSLTSTVVRASVVAAGVAVIAFASFVLAGVAGRRTGHLTLVWLAVLLGVSIAIPLVARPLERLGDRLAYGRQGNPYATLDEFVRRTAQTLPTTEVLPQLARTAAVATRSTRGEVRLWLADGAEWVQTWPPRATTSAGEVSVPLRHAGEDVGRLEVARPGRGADPVDGAVLDRLAGPAGLALSNVRLTLDLQHQVEATTRLVEALRISRSRLLTARAEQAERLGRQVDREVVARITTAESVLAPHPSGDLPGSLATARDEVAVALESLREISHGIYPPVLQRQGLRAALEWRRDHAGMPWRVAVHPETEWRVGTEVEAAAYFACVDLLSPGHGSARVPPSSHPDREAGIDLVQAAGVLHVRIGGLADVSEERTRLVRDRVEALGGDLEVDAGVGTATIRLPARMIE